jgi:hypothetical protein
VSLKRQTINDRNTLTELETSLNDFSPETRRAAFDSLLAQTRLTPDATHPGIDAVNMHAHTFFSFNAYGHSPTSLVWLARKNGYAAMGTVDFDVLDAVDEYLDACELAGVRGSCAIETRIYIPEFASREISSPGEPGVAYHMGIGFTSSRVTGEAARILEDMRQRASQRNRDLIERVNAYLSPVTIDYERDVLPLTPSGNATERHILVAYTRAAQEVCAKNGTDLVDFWAVKLGTPREQIASIIGDTPMLHNLIRSKLMKRGGVGYVQPGPTTFPSVEEFHQFILGCQALPCATWLDGTSKGEQAEEELLNLLIGKGVVALNIIPDRNWNIADAEQKRIKVQNLYNVVKLARSLDLPLNIGTEMNAYGQKLIDDFGASELAPVRQAFIDGAYFAYGHSILQRALGLGYQSEWSKSHIPTRAAKNAFYMQAGRCIPPGKPGLTLLKALPANLAPAELLAKLGR